MNPSTFKLFLIGSRDINLRTIEESIIKYYEKSKITHIISGGTNNFYPASELWGRNNNKIIIKYSPSLIGNFIENCKKRLRQCVEESDSTLILIGKEPSPSSDYVYSIVHNKPFHLYGI